MRKLINSLQNYAWGSKTALTELYGITSFPDQPMAELWMGAHPKSPSQVEIAGQRYSLREIIDENPEVILGKSCARHFGELPFLFKILCAAKPLSIQVHPDKAAAETGFARENAAGIALDAAERNYKDANHKPELVFALTPFKAINGFRELAQMVSLLQPLENAHPSIASFISTPDETNLRQLFSGLLSMTASSKSHALKVLKAELAHQQGEPWETIRTIATDYPDDNGLFSPLLLNVIILQPGEAMFLSAGTPHAYLHGVAMEVMANSDNVLRAGLTAKYVDIPELLANLKFIPRPVNTLCIQPVQRQNNILDFPVPAEDFSFNLHTLSTHPIDIFLPSATIFFCAKGEAAITKGNNQLILAAGESCFIAANEFPVTVCGNGQLAWVFNPIN